MARTILDRSGLSSLRSSPSTSFGICSADSDSPNVSPGKKQDHWRMYVSGPQSCHRRYTVWPWLDTGVVQGGVTLSEGSRARWQPQRRWRYSTQYAAHGDAEDRSITE